MTALAFDTHQFVKELTSVGFTEAQAEAVTSVVKRTRAVELDEIATKADLAHLATKVDLAELKAETARWLFGQTIVIMGAVAAIIKLLH